MLLDYLPPILPIFLGTWLAFFLAARFQTNRIKAATTELVLQRINPALQDNPHLTVEEYYEQLLPDWEEIVRKNAIFILHKLELWPIIASPANVKERLSFTPAWVGAYLKLHGQILPADQPLKKEISRIIKMVPQNPHTVAKYRTASSTATESGVPDSPSEE